MHWRLFPRLHPSSNGLPLAWRSSYYPPFFPRRAPSHDRGRPDLRKLRRDRRYKKKRREKGIIASARRARAYYPFPAEPDGRPVVVIHNGIDTLPWRMACNINCSSVASRCLLWTIYGFRIVHSYANKRIALNGICILVAWFGAGLSSRKIHYSKKSRCDNQWGLFLSM